MAPEMRLLDLVISLMYFGLVVFCLFKASAREFVVRYTSTAVPVFQRERLRFRFVRLWVRIGREYRAKNMMQQHFADLTISNLQPPTPQRTASLLGIVLLRFWLSYETRFIQKLLKQEPKLVLTLSVTKRLVSVVSRNSETASFRVWLEPKLTPLNEKQQ